MIQANRISVTEKSTIQRVWTWWLHAHCNKLHGRVRLNLWNQLARIPLYYLVSLAKQGPRCKAEITCSFNLKQIYQGLDCSDFSSVLLYSGFVPFRRCRVIPLLGSHLSPDFLLTSVDSWNRAYRFPGVQRRCFSCKGTDFKWGSIPSISTVEDCWELKEKELAEVCLRCIHLFLS